MATAHALAFTFVEHGDGTLKDIIGRTGRWAPMTPVGASSKRDNPKTSRKTINIYTARLICYSLCSLMLFKK